MKGVWSYFINFLHSLFNELSMLFFIYPIFKELKGNIQPKWGHSHLFSTQQGRVTTYLCCNRIDSISYVYFKNRFQQFKAIFRVQSLRNRFTCFITINVLTRNFALSFRFQHFNLWSFQMCQSAICATL